MDEKRRVETRGPTIGFICTTSAHFELNGAVDHLTIHEREWAYCHGNVRDGGNEWKPTGGATLYELQSLARAARQNGHPKAD